MKVLVSLRVDTETWVLRYRTMHCRLLNLVFSGSLLPAAMGARGMSECPPRRGSQVFPAEGARGAGPAAAEAPAGRTGAHDTGKDENALEELAAAVRDSDEDALARAWGVAPSRPCRERRREWDRRRAPSWRNFDDYRTGKHTPSMLL